ncbi:extracellular solute-binding protein [Cohnella cellulosilytica]|uniref:Extracellular solute-binding protein n=1 Tax=Cohnella cellulosilytica TaxID=986710 RepID=A0ABW2FFC2_9BACL
MRRTTIAATFLTVAMSWAAIALWLPGCGIMPGNADRYAARPAPKPQYAEHLTLTLMPFSWEGGLRWREDHPTIQYLNRKFNIDLQLQWTDGESYKDKLNVMAASGKLPDMFQVEPDMFVNWQDDGVFMDLQPVLDSYSHLSQAFSVGTWRLLNPEGALFGIPVNVVSNSDSYQIRADWLEKLGLGIPEEDSFTIDQFYTIVQSFALYDPDSDGISNTYGLSVTNLLTGEAQTNSAQLRAAFGLANEWALQDGRLVSQYAQVPEMKAFLGFLRKLYAEGLLDRNFREKGFTNIYDDFQSGRTGILTSHPDSLKSDELLLQRSHPGTRLVQLPPPIGPNGQRGNPTNLQGVNKSVINGRIEPAKQERILALLDWWATDEGTFIMRNGFEGLHFEINEDGSATKKPLTDSDLPRLLDNWFFSRSDIAVGYVYSLPEEIEFNRRYYERNAKYPYVNDAGGLEVLSLAYRWYYKKLEEAYRDVQIRIIRGELPLDSVDDAAAAWRRGGGDRITMEINEIYARNKTHKAASNTGAEEYSK